MALQYIQCIMQSIINIIKIIMNLVYVKPIYAAQKQIEYQRHVNRINQIVKSKKRQRKFRQQIRNHNLSANIQTKLNNQRINQENQKMLARLLDISHRKSVSFSNKLDYVGPQVVTMKPYRKKLMQRINEENEQLAERLISKQSEFNPSRINKSILQYEKIKRTMNRNKRLNLPKLRKSHREYLDHSI